MKKTIGLIAILCIAASLVSCGMPDPTTTVEMYFKEITNSDSDLAKQMMEEISSEYEEYPEVEKACNDLITAYLNTIEYTIHKDRTETDKQAKTARVYVTYTCVDMEELMSNILMSEELMNYALENYLNEEAVAIYMFDLITEEINSGDWTPKKVDTTVELQYDNAIKAWIITNEDDVFSALD